MSSKSYSKDNLSVVVSFLVLMSAASAASDAKYASITDGVPDAKYSTPGSWDAEGAMTIGPEGNLWMAEYSPSEGVVHQIDSDFDQLSEIDLQIGRIGFLHYYSPKDQFIVGERDNDKVYYYDSSWELEHSFSVSSYPLGGMVHPANGKFYYHMDNNDEIWRFSGYYPNTTVERKISHRGHGGAMFPADDGVFHTADYGDEIIDSRDYDEDMSVIESYSGQTDMLGMTGGTFAGKSGIWIGRWNRNSENIYFYKGQVQGWKEENLEESICDYRGPFNECIMNQTNQLSNQKYNISSVFEARENAVFEAFSGRVSLNITNSTSLSGLWRGRFNIDAEDPSIKPGAEFKPENGDIVIGK